MPADEFTEARLSRLADSTSDKTNPDEALKLAERYIDENGCSGNLLVLIERESGGVALLSSQVTLATAVFLLERAKADLLDGEYSDE